MNLSDFFDGLLRKQLSSVLRLKVTRVSLHHAEAAYVQLDDG